MRRVVFDSNWGVFFIKDTENLSEIPYDPNEIVSYGNDIINISCAIPDDGAMSTLIISEELDDLHESSNTITIFDQIVFFPSKQVQVHDSENNIFFFKKLGTNYASVKISINKDYEILWVPSLFHITIIESIGGINNDKS